MRMTLKSAFLITEIAMPAEISPTLAPSFWACLTFEFMKTVQRVPRSTGCADERAVLANASTVIPSDCEKLLIKEPQPEEQASFNLIESITPSLTVKLFISWPPMSMTKVTPGWKVSAARKCATVSTSPISACKAACTIFSP